MILKGPISSVSLVQQGVVAQYEFANILTLGTDGHLEAAAPLADDERRDFEIHVKGDYARGLAVQVKSARRLIRQAGHLYLWIQFAVADARVVNDPRFWYFFAHLDFRKMAFTEPVFLVPSAVVHAHAYHTASKLSDFLFYANVSPGSRDKWSPYRLSIAEVGPAVLRMISGLPLRLQASAKVGGLTAMPGMVWAKQLPTKRAA
jgi:hypothetical protein